jgi:uncharacterized protein (TIGR02001 family)
MKIMKKFVGAAMLAGAALAGTAGVANAEGSFSGNINFVSDYVFRGLSQTNSGAAVQGGMDYTNGIFYAGAWGSNVDFQGYEGSMELDGYFGVTPTTGPISWNLGVIGYFYPGATDSNKWDYYELKVAPSIKLTDALTVGAAVYYSPDAFGDGTDESWDYEGTAGYAFSDAFSVSATYGALNQAFEGGAGDQSYSYWSVGGSYMLSGFKLGLTYTDTSGADHSYFDTSESGESLSDSAVVFSIGRAL